MGVVAEAIRRKLQSALSPARLEIVDDSDKHAGHGGHNEAGESHFTVTVISDVFTGLSRLDRQRRVNALLSEELAGRVHALSIRASAPGE